MTNKPRKPTTPGEVLKEEFMRPLNISNRILAAATGLPEGSISPFLHGRTRVTYEIAYRLAKYLGTTIQFWLNLQEAVDHYVLTVDTFKMRHIDGIVPITAPLEKADRKNTVTQ